MRTIPATYSSALTANLPVLYFVDMQLSSSGVLNHLYLTNAPSGSVQFTYSGSVVQGVQSSYMAAKILDSHGSITSVEGVGSIDFTGDLSAGGISGINSTSLTLLNQGNFGQENVYDLSNHSVKIWQGFTPLDGTVTVENEMLCVFSGLIKSAADYDNTQFRIELVDPRKEISRMLPSRIVTIEDYPNAPDGAVGKNIPFLVGDFKTENETPVVTSDGISLFNHHFGCPNVAPTVVVDKFTSRAVVSQGPSALTKAYIIDDPKAMVTIPHSSSVTYISGAGTGQSWTDFGGDVFGDAYLTPSGVGPSAGREVPATGLQFASASVDGDPTTYTPIWNTAVESEDSQYISVKPDGGSSFGDMIIGGFEHAYDSTVAGDTDIRVVTYYDLMNSTAGEWRTSLINHTLGDPSLTPGVTLSDLSGTHITRYSLGLGPGALHDAFSWSSLRSDYCVQAYYNGGSLTNDKSLRVRHIALELRTRYNTTYTTRKPERVLVSKPVDTHNGTYRAGHSSARGEWTTQYMVIEEHEGTALSNVYVSATGPTYPQVMVTGRSHGYTTGSVLENPGHVIEYLLRMYMGITTAEIDTASFDLVANTTDGTRKDWKIATSIQRGEEVVNIIRRVAHDGGCMLTCESSGKYRLVTLDDATPVYTITSSDIVFDGYPLISVTTTDEVYNDVRLTYRTNYITNSPESTLYISDTNGDCALNNNLATDSGAPGGATWTSWMSGSIAKYRTTYKYELSSDLIRDDQTAELLLKHIAAWNAYRRLKVSMSTRWTSATLALEVGDVVLIDDPILGSMHRNTTHFMISRVSVGSLSGGVQEPRLTIECEEVPNQYTGTNIQTSRFISSEHLLIR
jgi:hypothetical protein